MEEKVINKIAHESGHDTAKMIEVKKNPNDECYTSMQDIWNELEYWGALGKFRGKRIICPCDWDIEEGGDVYSVTIEYNDNDVVTMNGITLIENSVERISYDLFNPQKETFEKVEVSRSDFGDFLRKKLTCNFLRTITMRAHAWGVRSVTASGYNPDVGRGVPFQSVDFSKYDVCVTNPPFSLYGEFMAAIVGKIDFCVLAPFLNRSVLAVALPLYKKQAYLGHIIHLNLDFSNPTPENRYGVKTVSCDWLVSWPEAQAERNKAPRRTYISYEDYKDEYQTMENITMRDGTHPIIVSAGTVPDDYAGWMFGPISVLDGIDMDGCEWYCTKFAKYFEEHPEENPCAHPFSSKMRVHNGKEKFTGIIFRRKPEGND